jgi:hypothetical protein
MPKTYEPIQTTTVGTATPSITFSSIPQTYTDLIVVGQGSAASDIIVRFNGDSTALYSNTRLYGDGATAATDRSSGQTSYSVTLGGFGNSNFILQLNNYSNTTTFKTGLVRANLSTGYVGSMVGLYRSTAAITSILLQSNSGNLSVGATFTIYGIKAA